MTHHRAKAPKLKGIGCRCYLRLAECGSMVIAVDFAGTRENPNSALAVVTELFYALIFWHQP